MPQYRPSRFNSWLWDGADRLLVSNSFSSALLEFSGETAQKVAFVLEGSGQCENEELSDYLQSNWVLVPQEFDEMAMANRLHEAPFQKKDRLGLTLLSHENCNFRCVYCYETFEKQRMLPEVAEGVVALVRKRAPALTSLSLSWFGGEPLLAYDLVESLSLRLREICEGQDVMYGSSMTTNGYFLDDRKARGCIAAGVKRFQVTLDGPAETHNLTRVLAGGGPTFDTILKNLRHMRDTLTDFHVVIRVNFSPTNLHVIPDFVRFLGREFGEDKRFSVRFRPVGHWGGPRDQLIQICDAGGGETTEISLMKLASENGISLSTWQEGMQPFGSVCYAASPNHFVIGSDGIVYKCTVVFDDPRNHVGRLDSHGELNLVGEKVDLWTRSGEETDADCQTCHFRPACQGNLCPLERLDHRPKRCPITKSHSTTILPILANDARKAALVPA
jgi:uncharacterized protein